MGSVGEWVFVVDATVCSSAGNPSARRNALVLTFRYLIPPFGLVTLKSSLLFVLSSYHALGTSSPGINTQFLPVQEIPNEGEGGTDTQR